MAKTYLESTKYMIHTKFEIDGVVDKPDIVGAIFGQSEGLLGEEMDLKELQKAGKLGRIEIDYKQDKGKTKGEILTPSSMDMVQTSLLAATFESVDKVGPCDAKFSTDKIEDVRSSKRAEITSRAQEILTKFKSQTPDSMEIETTIREESRASKVKSFGRDKLPCGPEAESAHELILVEGRADVINLLRNNINNAAGVGGSKISNDIKKLARGKEVTVFIDGDRGGELNLRKLKDMIPVDYVARAPEGKEVEELTSKEIMLSLRRKVGADEQTSKFEDNSYQRGRRTDSRESYPRGGYSGRDSGRDSYSRGRDSGRSNSYNDRSYNDRRGSSRGYGNRDSRYGRDSGYNRGPRDSGFSRGRDSGYNRGPRDSGFSRGRDSGYNRDRRDSRGSYGPRDSGRGRDSGYNRGSGPSRSFGSRDSGRDSRGLGNKPSSPRGSSFGVASTPSDRPLPVTKPTKEEEEKFRPIMDEVKKNKLKAKLFDKNMKELAELGVRELVNTLSERKDVHAVVFDGIITQRLAETAEAQKVAYLVGVKKGRVTQGENTKLVIMG